LCDREARKNNRGDERRRPKIKRYQCEPDQRADQDPGLVEDIEHGERFHTPVACIGGEIGAYRWVE
jgi:hypothetical protein